MHLFRRLVVRTLTPLLSLLILASLTLLSLNINFAQPDNLKHWLASSRIFDAVVPTIVAQSKQTGPNEDPSLSRPEVQTALQKAVTPEFLQTTSNHILDGTYTWLQGKTAKPSYDVDLTPLKAAFAGSLGDQARQRLASLPACTLSQPSTSDDPFVTNCRPPAAATETQIQKLVSDITKEDDFLGQSHLTADTQPSDHPPATNHTADNRPWYQQASKLPLLYHWMQIGPWLLGSLALLLAGLIVLASPTKRQGCRQVAWTVFSAGLLLAASAGLTLVIVSKLNFANSAETVALHQPLITFTKSVASGASRPLLISGVVLLTSAVGSLIFLHKTQPQPTPETNPIQSQPPHKPLA